MVSTAHGVNCSWSQLLMVSTAHGLNCSWCQLLMVSTAHGVAHVAAAGFLSRYLSGPLLYI